MALVGFPDKIVAVLGSAWKTNDVLYPGKVVIFDRVGVGHYSSIIDDVEFMWSITDMTTAASYPGSFEFLFMLNGGPFYTVPNKLGFLTSVPGGMNYNFKDIWNGVYPNWVVTGFNTYSNFPTFNTHSPTYNPGVFSLLMGYDEYMSSSSSSPESSSSSSSSSSSAPESSSSSSSSSTSPSSSSSSGDVGPSSSSASLTVTINPNSGLQGQTLDVYFDAHGVPIESLEDVDFGPGITVNSVVIL